MSEATNDNDHLPSNHDSYVILTDVEDALSSLASAFYQTGNPTVANRLSTLAERVVEARDIARDAYNRVFGDYYAAIQSGPENSLMACLAGIELATRSGQSESD